MARLSSQTPLDAWDRPAPAFKPKKPREMAAWHFEPRYSVGAVNWKQSRVGTAKPAEIIVSAERQEAALEKIAAEIRYFAQNTMVEAENVYPAHHRVCASDVFQPAELHHHLVAARNLLAEEPRRADGNLTFWNRITEEDRRAEGLSTTSHRDSRRAVRPIWNKDELKRLRGELRVQTKADQEVFVNRFTASAIAERVILPNQIEAAHRLLDAICVPDDPEFLRVATGKRLKGEETDWSENVWSTVHLNMVAGRMVMEGYRPIPRVRTAPPGVNATVAADGSVLVGLRRKERNQTMRVHGIEISKRARPPLKSKSGKARSLTMIETLAICAMSWTSPTFATIEPECDVFDIKDLLLGADALAIAA